MTGVMQSGCLVLARAGTTVLGLTIPVIREEPKKPIFFAEYARKTGFLISARRLELFKQVDNQELPRRIMSKNSALFLVAFILSRMNSIASISSIPYSSLRKTQIFCS